MGGELISSSRNRDWSNIIVEKWAHDAYRLPSIVPTSTEVSIQIGGTSVVERESGGKIQRVLSKPGTVWLCPAGVREDYIDIRGRIECLHIYVPNICTDERFSVKKLSASTGYRTIVQDMFILNIAKMALAELESESASRDAVAEAIGVTLMNYLSTLYYSESPDLACKTAKTRPLDKRRLDLVEEFVVENLEGNVGVEQLARVACQSTSHFTRSFKVTTGQTPAEYVTMKRMEAAKSMLSQSDMMISEICYALGFSSQANFSRAFRRAAGMTPKQYRIESGRLCYLVSNSNVKQPVQPDRFVG